jgi:hypothetical protein
VRGNDKDRLPEGSYSLLKAGQNPGMDVGEEEKETSVGFVAVGVDL